MSKDKEWLVKEVYRLRLENTLSNNPMMISNRDVIAKVSRLIDQLDEPEITVVQAWNKDADRLSDYLLRNFEKEIGGNRDYETPVDAAIRLLGERGNNKYRKQIELQNRRIEDLISLCLWSARRLQKPNAYYVEEQLEQNKKMEVEE